MESFLYILVAVALFAFQAYSDGQKKKRRMELQQRRREEGLDGVEGVGRVEGEELPLEQFVDEEQREGFESPFDFLIRSLQEQERRAAQSSVEEEEEESVSYSPFESLSSEELMELAAEPIELSTSEINIESDHSTTEEIVVGSSTIAEEGEEEQFQFDPRSLIIYSALATPRFRD